MSSSTASDSRPDMKLFWACFIALVATSFFFGVRANSMGLLQDAFNLSENEKGAINGGGMWPFAISIIFFSLVIDWVGYKTVAVFAIVCHLIALVLTLSADGFKSFYYASILIGLANGTVEAFVNPVVATLFPKDKSKWLNILHAGWPAGLALGALFCAVFPTSSLMFDAVWKFRFALCMLPVLAYALLILPCKFPVNERVAAGVSYREMLKEVGAVGFFIIGFLIYFAIMQLAGKEASLFTSVIAGAAIGAVAGIYTGSLGNWMFLLVLVIIGPLATTELGTDGWMPDLLQLNSPSDSPNFAAWVFVYVSAIMTILRFYAGPIVHRFSPIGLLVLGSGVAIVGLLLLSQSTGWAIVAASTIYAFGKTFLWSTTLGLTAEQFPKGGALTLNGVSAVGVLFLGVLGSPFIGYQMDYDLHHRLQSDHGVLLAKVEGQTKDSIFGKAPSLDQAKIKALPVTEIKELEAVQADSKRGAFTNIAVLPGFMLVCYLGMFLWFRAKGGYKPVAIGGH